MVSLVPGRGVLGCEYAGDLIAKIENSNCRKGCAHADPQDGGQWFNCDLGLLARVFDEAPIPEFDLHGSSYVTCLMRQPSEPAPVHDPGPDLFSKEAMG